MTQKIQYVTSQPTGSLKTNKSKPVKDRDGNIIIRLEQQLVRWKEHFVEVLNGEQIPDPLELSPRSELTTKIGPITKTRL